MKNLYYLLAAFALSLSIPSHASALNWPTCPTAAQISHSLMNRVAYTSEDMYALTGTPITVNNQIWYIYAAVHATNQAQAMQMGQSAINAVIDNPFERYEGDLYGCSYNTTINYTTEVVATTSPINFSLLD